tara:strand:+ start:2838 stop:3770 length:933 start_codon:yes stop_codon:yes gene_type:complete
MTKVSIIIPAYGHAEYILEALKSVFWQTYNDFEVIVVNDGSPDNTEEVLAEYIESEKIRYILQQNQGVATARNTGLERATGEFVAFLDDDDVWPEDKLAQQVQLIESCDAVMVGGTCKIYAPGDGSQNLDRTENSCEVLATIDFFSGNPFTSPGQTLIRKSALDAIGGYNSAIWGVDDLDLWIRLSRIGEIHYYRRVVLYYRLHESNASLNLEKMARNTELVIRQNLNSLPDADQAHYERIGYRFLFRCAGKKLLWKGAKYMRQGRKDEGRAMIQLSLSIFKPRFRSDKVLFFQFLMSILKIPWKMEKVR